MSKGNPSEIRGLEDLTRTELKIGLGNAEACAIGRKSQRIFEKNRIDPSEINVQHFASTVNNLATQIELGHLDAVIVWDSVAAQIGSAGHVVPIPAQQNRISTAAIGVLKSAEYPELAEQFAEFLTSDRAKEVFAKHNYTTSLDEQAPSQ